uniref:Ubiquinol-cytochrome c reductase complex assembly factor 4 n=1 Tax=Esox lucius TaxID=8010 RepID=A0A3P8Y0V9_ESOLU
GHIVCLVPAYGKVRIHDLLTTSRLSKPKKPADEEDEELNQPIKFSTSKASQKIWNVDKSFGSQYQRPWWKVLPISLLGVSLLLWCALRSETDIDEQGDVNNPSYIIIVQINAQVYGGGAVLRAS